MKILRAVVLVTVRWTKGSEGISKPFPAATEQYKAIYMWQKESVRDFQQLQWNTKQTTCDKKYTIQNLQWNTVQPTLNIKKRVTIFNSNSESNGQLKWSTPNPYSEKLNTVQHRRVSKRHSAVYRCHTINTVIYSAEPQHYIKNRKLQWNVPTPYSEQLNTIHHLRVSERHYAVYRF